MTRTKGAIVTLAAMVVLWALPAVAWDGFVQNVTVRVIEPYMDGQFIVTFVQAGTSTVVNLCPGPAQNTFASTWGVIKVGTPFPNPDGTNRLTSADGVKQLYATLLGAKLGGRPLNVYANNDPSAPTSNLCVIGVVDLL
jgi:hypothetical protein